MTTAWIPKWTLPPADHLREFVERWAVHPTEAMACASLAKIPAERWQELLDGTGKPMTLLEASDVGMMLGPNIAFWQNLVKQYNDRDAG
ncbi:MAG TPA: hypothetical protein VK735_39760 [Pseudonocardia sp.]|uniref:hypothetical protein n=1 Tax=Pseudonocardia sp. TaxID=60912 RepID=UPI002D124DB5|nr:hypothetical protein [Pseudonocardia sp.]HTF53620.1 hypothetical protein [Pseudonocardia sp.]